MSPKKLTLVHALLLVGICWIGTLELKSQSLDLGGSARGYFFFRLEDLPDFIDLRRDTEFTSFRFTLDSEFNPSIRLEAHGVLDFLSPSGSGAARIAQSPVVREPSGVLTKLMAEARLELLAECVRI